MVTIRCTQKLLRRLHPTEETHASTTVLGDWYANIAFSRPQQLVLCVSERTLLPIVLPAKGLETLVPRLSMSVGEVLTRLGVNRGLIQREQDEMRSFTYGRTQNRRVLGSLNDFMFLLAHYLEARPDATLIEHSLQLAQAPCTPIGHRSPDRVTPELFQTTATVAKTH
jgi:uncharacterized protein DUF6933